MPQFHNRSTPRGRLVWDVERLILLAKDLLVKRVPLESIFEFDQVYWFDDEYRPTCRAIVAHMQRIEEVDLA